MHVFTPERSEALRQPLGKAFEEQGNDLRAYDRCKEEQKAHAHGQHEPWPPKAQRRAQPYAYAQYLEEVTKYLELDDVQGSLSKGACGCTRAKEAQCGPSRLSRRSKARGRAPVAHLGELGARSLQLGPQISSPP